MAMPIRGPHAANRAQVLSGGSLTSGRFAAAKAAGKSGAASRPELFPARYQTMDRLDASPQYEISVSSALTTSALASPNLGLLDGASLFLDFDGTLVDIAAHPAAVEVGDRLRGLLARLSARLPQRLAIISGRPIHQLEQLLGSTSLAFAGSHGVEIRWPDGSFSGAERPAELTSIIHEATRLQKLHSGIVIERKPFGVAIHYRGEPQAEAACMRLATALAQTSGLALQTGKMVFELRVAGADKGDALRALAACAEMRGTRPIFIGDDDTDEAAFVAAAALGGAGILVGQPRPTAARYRLDDVASTLAWLDAACRGVP